MKIVLIISILAFFCISGVFSQEERKEGYQFTDEKVLKVSPVKNQNRAGTCWSYSTLSFIEAEMLRMGKEEVDLSEPYVFRMAYEDKAEKYVRMHGTTNFGGGGAVNDPIDTYIKYGLIPEENYKGLNYGEDNHVHGEIDNVLKAYVDAVIENKNKKLSTAWFEGYKGILNAYFGAIPEKFSYKGKDYTPRTFSDQVIGINPNDYVYLSSFSHHPFYTQFAIEVQDNWSWQKFYNLPIDELIAVYVNSINNGYTVGWASDVSEKGFSSKDGIAVVPTDVPEEMDGLERAKWETMSKKERESYLTSFDKPIKEKVVTQEMRQLAFDNYQTTDDHGMLIMGLAKDQNGTRYFKVKNSWGTDYNDYGGFFYASETFVKYKTLSCVVHKNAIPKDIAKKLGL
ncbi:MAG: C1 family peptidase [Bacteroidota bacterium]